MREFPANQEMMLTERFPPTERLLLRSNLLPDHQSIIWMLLLMLPQLSQGFLMEEHNNDLFPGQRHLDLWILDMRRDAQRWSIKTKDQNWDHLEFLAEKL